MAYAAYEDYKALYGGDTLDEAGFARLVWEGSRIMDDATTGADGVRKLRLYPPADEAGAEAVRRCACALVRLLWQQEQEGSYVNHAGGGVSSPVVTAITAGSESVSFAAPAAVPAQERQTHLARTAARYLAGVPDANGVNLTYMGRYPVKMGG